MISTVIITFSLMYILLSTNVFFFRITKRHTSHYNNFYAQLCKILLDKRFTGLL